MFHIYIYIRLIDLQNFVWLLNITINVLIDPKIEITSNQIM